MSDFVRLRPTSYTSASQVLPVFWRQTLTASPSHPQLAIQYSTSSGLLNCLLLLAHASACKLPQNSSALRLHLRREMLDGTCSTRQLELQSAMAPE